jgi:hypothetical protein
LTKAVELQELTISNEQVMINTITAPGHQANPKLIEIDTLRLQDSISGHKDEIDTFEKEIKDEQGRRRDTEQMIMYLEIQE